MSLFSVIGLQYADQQLVQQTSPSPSTNRINCSFGLLERLAVV